MQLVLKMCASVFFDMQVCRSVPTVNGYVSMCFSPAAQSHCMKIPSGGKTKRVLLAFVLGTIFVQVTLDPVFALLIHLMTPSHSLEQLSATSEGYERSPKLNLCGNKQLSPVERKWEKRRNSLSSNVEVSRRFLVKVPIV